MCNIEIVSLNIKYNPIITKIYGFFRASNRPAEAYSNVTDVADWGDANVGHLVQHCSLVVITLVLRP